MDKLINFSAVPVGERFIDPKTQNNYIKSSVGRATLIPSKNIQFKFFKKHYKVEWVNPWPNQLEN
jgi:hypothetical protein